MKTATIHNNAATMTSIEIAEYTGKQHRNVTADIKKMLIELELEVLNFQQLYLSANNQQQTMYVLDRDLTDCLLTGYNAKARLKVVQRWHELEAQAKEFQIPTTLHGALQLAAELEQGKQAALLEVTKQKLLTAKSNSVVDELILKTTTLVTVTKLAEAFNAMLFTDYRFNNIGFNGALMNTFLCGMNMQSRTGNDITLLEAGKMYGQESVKTKSGTSISWSLSLLKDPDFNDAALPLLLELSKTK